MPFKIFSDVQKQFLSVGIYCKKNTDGSHSKENVLKVLDMFRRLPIEKGSTVSNSDRDNYIAATVKCYENEVEESSKVVKTINEIESIEIGTHWSLNELDEYIEEFDKESKK